MKMKLLIMLAFLAFSIAGFAQNHKWEKWNWLTGEWIGDGEGQPGAGSGGFSFKPELDNNILVRRAKTEFPATANKPKSVHEDLMIIYLDYTQNPVKAIYFDNEGHTINYSISYAEKTIVLTSEKNQNVPVFRLTYSLIDSKTVNTKFEMSQDGVNFTTYIEGKSKKIN